MIFGGRFGFNFAVFVLLASFLFVLFSDVHYNSVSFDSDLVGSIPSHLFVGVSEVVFTNGSVSRFNVVNGFSEGERVTGIYQRDFSYVKVMAYYPDGAKRDDHLIYQTLLHELGHHMWFQNMSGERRHAFCEQVDWEDWSDRSCVEGFADYFATYYYVNLTEGLYMDGLNSSWVTG